MKSLGDFELGEVIGRGGMGVVYKAVQKSLRRPVAVKVLPARFGADAEFVTRFRGEAIAAAQLVHPNVIQVYDSGVEGGRLFFAMELVDGQSLKDRLKLVGHLPPLDAVRIAESVASALLCAYDHGVIHRDLKPGNIMIDRRGEVKVLDFGLARTVREDYTRVKTRAGTFMGTVRYASPEQIVGGEIDHRSDIYSLGCVLYLMLTGTIPFQGRNNAEIFKQHLEAAPDPPRSRMNGISERLESIVLQMLAKSPDKRHATPKLLLDDLQAYRRADVAERDHRLLPVRTRPQRMPLVEEDWDSEIDIDVDLHGVGGGEVVRVVMAVVAIGGLGSVAYWLLGI